MSDYFNFVRRRWWAFPAFHALVLMGLASGLRVGLLAAYGPEGTGMGAILRTLGFGLWADAVVAAVVVLPLAVWCAFRRRPW